MKIPAAPARAFDATPFAPAPWIRGGHAQTIAGRGLRAATPRLATRRFEVPAGDGVILTIDAVDADPPRGAVLVLHGLEGHGASGYVRETMRNASSRSLSAAVLNFRSCDGRPLRSSRMYNAGDTGDLASALAWMAGRYPDVPRAAVGFSLGGNLLLKWLGEEGEAAREMISAAVAVSVPFDLATGADRLERGFSRLYAWYFLRSLRRKVRTHAHVLAEHLDMRAVLAARTLRAFDQGATAPLHGYAGADEYYRLSSSRAYLGGVRVPTLLIQAADDPFSGAGELPRAAVATNPFLVPAFTRHGGHVGFVEAGGGEGTRLWAEREAVRFVSQTFEQSSETTESIHR